MRRFVMVTLLALVACESDEPCQDYIDYICACHDGEEGFDCEEFEKTYGDADADVQDDCAIGLDEQKEADEAAGLSCEV